MGRGLAELTADSEYLSDRSHVTQAPRAPPSRSYSEGLSLGASTIASSVARGVSSAVKEPMKGAQATGLEGFFRGVAKGAVGFAVPPPLRIKHVGPRRSNLLHASLDLSLAVRP